MTQAPDPTSPDDPASPRARPQPPAWPQDSPGGDGVSGNALLWHGGDMPYSTAFGDHFYCQTDGRLECGHVFLNGNGLPERWQNGSDFTIGELGFGTGLNAMETWRQWKQHRRPGQQLTFLSFELHPMAGSEIDRALGHWPELEDERRALLRHWPDNAADIGDEHIEIRLDDQTILTVVCGDAPTRLAAWPQPAPAAPDRDHGPSSPGSLRREPGDPTVSTAFDAWFLDGFSPARNGDLWSLPLMTRLFALTRPGGSFATYAAAGFVRRNLIAAGFAVERRKGFAGKREMLCGTRPLT